MPEEVQFTGGILMMNSEPIWLGLCQEIIWLTFSRLTDFVSSIVHVIICNGNFLIVNFILAKNIFTCEYRDTLYFHNVVDKHLHRWTKRVGKKPVKKKFKCVERMRKSFKKIKILPWVTNINKHAKPKDKTFVQTNVSHQHSAPPSKLRCAVKKDVLQLMI